MYYFVFIAGQLFDLPRTCVALSPSGHIFLSVCLSICPSFCALPLLRFYQTRNKHNWCAGLASICCARSENVCVRLCMCVCMLLFRAFLLTFTHCCRRQTHTSSRSVSLPLSFRLHSSHAYQTHTHVYVCRAAGGGIECILFEKSNKSSEIMNVVFIHAISAKVNSR